LIAIGVLRIKLLYRCAHTIERDLQSIHSGFYAITGLLIGSQISIICIIQKRNGAEGECPNGASERHNFFKCAIKHELSS